MKQLRKVGVATALLCATAMLIAGFILLFSYTSYSPDDKSKENFLDRSSVTHEPITDLKNKIRK